ncbi:MAG TPA: hypothetical protein ACFCUD_12195 [Cyclobacteriaceae bacterium]
MKTLLTVALCFVLSTKAFCQPPPEELAIYQNIFGLNKKAAFSNFINLDEGQNDDFWALYDEYEAERKELGKQRIALIVDYAQNYYDLDDDKIHEMFKSIVKLRSAFDKLTVKYYGKIRKATNTVTAAKFFQLENYFAEVVNIEIASKLPFIEEVKR